MNSTGTTYRRNSDGTITTLLGPEGTVIDPLVAKNVYLANAYQRISYSFHQQGGILANFTTRPTDFLTVTAGGEYRSWTADHPGHFTNLFGKTSINQSYARTRLDRKDHDINLLPPLVPGGPRWSVQ